MNTPPFARPASRPLVVAHLIIFSALACIARGQAVAPAATANTASPASSAPTSTAPSPAPAPVVELSVFEVRAEDDVGYQAGNTTSGSRLNSRLKDTPASVSPFTPEFLADIAATNLQEMLSYATNIEVELEDAQAGFNNPPGRDSTGGDYSFRVRGTNGSRRLASTRSTSSRAVLWSCSCPAWVQSTSTRGPSASSATATA